MKPVPAFPPRVIPPPESPAAAVPPPVTPMPTLPPPVKPPSLGENIRAARQARGLTQYELAVAIGWKGGQGSGIKKYTNAKGEETRYEYEGSPNSAQVSRIESGRQEPTLGTLRAIAEALGVSLDALVNGRGV